MSTKKVIPSGNGGNFGGYLWFLVRFLGFATDHVKATYLRILLTEMPLGSADSIAPEIDGPAYVGYSPCSLAFVHVYLFCGGVELGFWAFCFALGIKEDLI